MFPLFGIGILAVTPGGSNPTPNRAGILKDVSLEVGGDPVELYGSSQFPVDVAIAKRTISGKGKLSAFGSGTVAAVTGGAVASGIVIGVIDETHTIPAASGPYTVQVTNHTGFYENLGVIDLTTGYPMSAGAAAAAGVYSLDTASGTFTFAAADATKAIAISYSYTSGSVGKTVTLSNALMGTATTFKLDLHNSYKSRNFGVRLPAVIIPKLNLTFKSDGHGDVDIDFKGFADVSGEVAKFFFTA